MTTAARIEGERSVARKLIRGLRTRGFTVWVWDGEEWEKGQSEEAHMDAIFGVDESRVTAFDADGKRVGSFYLVRGNAPDELIADYTDNELCEEIWKETVA